MESYEKRSDEVESEASRLEEEGDRVERQIQEAKSDWKSKQGQVPGMEPDPADTHDAAELPGEAEEGEEPNATAAE